MGAWLICIALSAAWGSIPFTVVIPIVLGKHDPRVEGSHVPGVANVAMSLGRSVGLLVALLEGSKGLLAVLVPRLFSLPPVAGAVCLFAAVVATALSPWLQLRGGQARTPGLWGLLFGAPVAFAAIFAVYGAVLLVSRSDKRADIAALLAIGPALALAANSVVGLLVGAPFTAFYLWRRRAVAGDTQHYRILGEMSE